MCRGKVVWVTMEEGFERGDPLANAGIQFIDITEKNQQMIAQYVRMNALPDDMT